jgi:predicted CXXCH cytochrome family protein
MPLVNKKMSCITCHYVHPFSNKSEDAGYFLLRKPKKSILFCSSCHEVDYKEHKHLYYENIHEGSSLGTRKELPIDLYTLQCVECHERYMDDYFASSLTESRNSRSRVNHPVGRSLTGIAGKYPDKFNQVSSLSSKVRLFGGKIGGGTCHNAFSKEKFMLVIRNDRSELCFECHKK